MIDDALRAIVTPPGAHSFFTSAINVTILKLSQLGFGAGASNSWAASSRDTVSGSVFTSWVRVSIFFSTTGFGDTDLWACSPLLSREGLGVSWLLYPETIFSIPIRNVVASSRECLDLPYVSLSSSRTLIILSIEFHDFTSSMALSLA